MSLKDYKITDDAVQNVYVQSQPDILNGTTQENKAAFDAYPALIKDRFNAVLEILGGDSAASEMLIQAIEGLTAGNVQQALAELKGLLDAYIAKIKSTAGAAEVGVSTISGMSASNAQQALVELKRLIDNLVISALPPGSVTADMIANGAIVQLGALLAVAAAAAYDPEGSYAVGDYCTHGGTLQKCSTDIPSGEAWTAEHWTETSVAAELHSLLAPLGGATTAQEALAALGAGVMPNELDNAYFVGGGTGWGVFPVNQKGKREYSGNTYTIDRWNSSNSRGVITVLEDCVKLTSTESTSFFRQMLKKIILAGEIWTLSAIVKCVGSGYIGFTDYKGTNTSIKTQPLGDQEWDVITCTLDGTQELDADSVTIRCDTPTSEIMLKAAKLEPGIMQTLGYKDADGVHLLPQSDSDYAMQLLKCQQYYQLYSSAEERPEKAVDCRPVMRIDPTQGTIQINGQTYYYNSAEL